MGRSKRSNWAADFETTTDANDCRVWAWGLANVDTAKSAWDIEMGNSIETFIERISKFSSVVYFHNLAFDGVFIIDKLFRMGFYHHTKFPVKGEFTTLISNTGHFYSITVHWQNGNVTEFRDSLKKLPFKIAVIADAFNLPVVKGDLDYHTFRPVGHVLTADEKKYLANDVLILALALKIQLDSGMTKLTVGSDSLEDFKQMIGKPIFNRMFPVLPESMDTEIRKAYRGGFTYADDRFRGKVTGSGRTYDVNSLYPSVMYDRLLPYGTPVWREGGPEELEDYPLFITSITFTAKLKKNHIPCIQVKGSSQFLATEYQTEIVEPVTLSCTNIDLSLWEAHYDLDILCFNGTWHFKGIKGIFKGYIDKWMEVKANSDGGMRVLAKLHLNSLYGKFATNPNITGKIPVLEDNIVKLKMGPPETRDPVYTAMGVFITAYARDLTIRSAQENYDTFAYADTDSLHLLQDTDPDNLWVDPKALGAWKFEYAFDRALFIRAKSYIEHKANGEHETHVAGLPVAIAERLTIEDFVGGRRFEGKLNPRRVPGGIVLEDVGFTLPTW